MHEKDLYWLAGMLEGEGCFSPARSRTGSVSPRIQVTSVDFDVLERIQSLLGGSICGPLPIRKPTHTPTYSWSLGGWLAADFMQEIHPLMAKRRRKQIDKAMKDFLAYAKHYIPPSERPIGWNPSQTRRRKKS